MAALGELAAKVLAEAGHTPTDDLIHNFIGGAIHAQQGNMGIEPSVALLSADERKATILGFLAVCSHEQRVVMAALGLKREGMLPLQYLISLYMAGAKARMDGVEKLDSSGPHSKTLRRADPEGCRAMEIGHAHQCSLRGDCGEWPGDWEWVVLEETEDRKVLIQSPKRAEFERMEFGFGEGIA